MGATTLKQILEKHPEWADLPAVIYCADGHYDWVGGAGAAYKSEACNFEDNYAAIPEDAPCKQNKDCKGCKYSTEVVVFAPN